MVTDDINLQNMQLFDPGALQRSAPYINNGLTYISNNPVIHPRDAAGNIILQENSENNPLLIIEPVSAKISNRSVLRVTNTAFQYFTFPVAVNEITELPEIDTDLNVAADTITTRLVIPYEEFPEGIPNGLRRMNTSGSTNWFTNGNENTSGFARLPFTGGTQLEPGTFIITPDILNFLRLQNKTIKFSIQVQTRQLNANNNNSVGYNVRLVRTNPTQYREFERPRLYTETFGEYNNGGSDPYPLLSMQYILNVDDLFDFDKFAVEAVSQKSNDNTVSSLLELSWYLSDTTVWDIELIDNDPNLLINASGGVIAVSEKTDLFLTIGGEEQLAKSGRSSARNDISLIE